MNKTILFTIIASILISTTVFALPRINQSNKDAFKAMLKNYLSPVIHGYGIGYTADTYIIAKWHITNVKTLSRNEIRNIIQQANSENITDWGIIRERIRERLNEGITVRKGRIRIEGTNYLLTNITVSDTHATADIREIPNWEDCKNQNITMEECENNANKVGYIDITKKTRASQEIANEPRVWAGTLNFKGIDYTFVTFVYPR
ncbi:MAG: hypothetical protein QXD55_00620 [Candidatus Aenigmatarchaeota archaeon]